ncbi:MAG: LysR family transcriptional regulator [Pseudomonadota bacterium]
MEMYQIRYVLAAADHLNFTRAAASCHVSQPALTKGIKALEAELDAPLFHREGRKIILSRLGRSLLPHLRQIAAEAQAAQTIASNFNLLSEVPVRLGVQASIGPSRFGPLLQVFGNAHADVEVSIHVGAGPDLARSLQGDDLDLAVVASLPELEGKLTLLPLYRERYAIALPADHPLCAQDSLTLRDLDGIPVVGRLQCEIREVLRAAFESRSIRFNARFRAERDTWVQGMVQAGLGVAFFPELSVTQEGLQLRPLTDPVIEREVCLASVPGRQYPPAAAALVRLAQTFSWPH